MRGERPAVVEQRLGERRAPRRAAAAPRAPTARRRGSPGGSGRPSRSRSRWSRSARLTVAGTSSCGKCPTPASTRSSYPPCARGPRPAAAVSGSTQPSSAPCRCSTGACTPRLEHLAEPPPLRPGLERGPPSGSTPARCAPRPARRAPHGSAGSVSASGNPGPPQASQQLRRRARRPEPRLGPPRHLEGRDVRRRAGLASGRAAPAASAQGVRRGRTARLRTVRGAASPWSSPAGRPSRARPGARRARRAPGPGRRRRRTACTRRSPAAACRCRRTRAGRPRRRGNRPRRARRAGAARPTRTPGNRAAAGPAGRPPDRTRRRGSAGRRR